MKNRPVGKRIAKVRCEKQDDQRIVCVVSKSTYALGVVVGDEHVGLVGGQEALVVKVLQVGNRVGREGREQSIGITEPVNE